MVSQQVLKQPFGFDPFYVGGVLSIMLALVILGGIQRIAAVTSKIVPFMAVVYVMGAFWGYFCQPW